MSETIVTARREASLATYTLTPPHSPMLKGLEKQQKKREKKKPKAHYASSAKSKRRNKFKRNQGSLRFLCFLSCSRTQRIARAVLIPNKGNKALCNMIQNDGRKLCILTWYSREQLCVTLRSRVCQDGQD